MRYVFCDRHNFTESLEMETVSYVMVRVTQWSVQFVINVQEKK